MVDKTMNWTAPLGWIPRYGDYMSGQRTHGGGKDVNGERVQHKNGALRIRFHYPSLEQSEFYVAIPEFLTHHSRRAFLAV